jgi:hypothetical protein
VADRRDPELEAEDLAAIEAVNPSVAPAGQHTGASGGYGTGSGGETVASPTSAGSGEGDDTTSTAGQEPATDWLRREGGEASG